MGIYVDKFSCILCKDCREICPVGVFSFFGSSVDVGNGYTDSVITMKVDNLSCIDCFACIPECPTSAIYDTEGESPEEQEIVGDGGSSSSNSSEYEAPPPDPKKIISTKEFLSCLNIIGSSKLTIYVDQPISHTRKTYDIFNPTNVGHAFVSITQTIGGQTFTRTWGFYPKSFVTPINPNSPGVFVDNEAHFYDIALTVNITAGQTNAILTDAMDNLGGTYNLNTNNCTDYAIHVMELAGIFINPHSGTWPGGGGFNPGDLGEDIRGLNNPNYYIDGSGGVGDFNNGTCK
ncbi:MAG: 4Fe-4S dicluster domain-containing protein [Chitinophagaceae bacterium]